MNSVSSLGGPRVLLPAADLDRWVEELDDLPTPDQGLYGLCCSVTGYFGVIEPWEKPLFVFGDGPSDIFYTPDYYNGLFFRWEAADSLEQLFEFVLKSCESDEWDETIDIEVADPDLVLIDSCYVSEKKTPSLRMRMRPGQYRVRSRYAESESAMTIVHRFDLI